MSEETMTTKKRSNQMMTNLIFNCTSKKAHCSFSLIYAPLTTDPLLLFYTPHGPKKS